MFCFAEQIICYKFRLHNQVRFSFFSRVLKIRLHSHRRQVRLHPKPSPAESLHARLCRGEQIFCNVLNCRRGLFRRAAFPRRIRVRRIRFLPFLKTLAQTPPCRVRLSGYRQDTCTRTPKYRPRNDDRTTRSPAGFLRGRVPYLLQNIQILPRAWSFRF